MISSLLQEVKEGFEQGSFLISPCGCLGGAVWCCHYLQHQGQGRVGASRVICGLQP